MAGASSAGRFAALRQPAVKPLSAGQAAAQAQRTRHPVVVTALTTSTSVTTANPTGTFTVTESAQPSRAWRHGRWAALSPALRVQGDGRLSPAVTTNGLSLSGGGTGSLAVLTADARSLTLTWPGTLPVPVVSGATATYANVLPGVDLVLTADDQGGFSDTLVVHTAAAAANPALASLKLGFSSSGLVLSADAAGNLAASIGTGTPAMITAQAPQIWDSTPPPSGMATVTAPDGTVLAAATGQPVYSTVTAPGAAANIAAVPVSLSATAITLSPPASALTGAGITYPVYVDPSFHNFASTSAAAWTQVDSGFPGTSYWHESSDLQSGKCPVDLGGGYCNGLGVARSFIRMPIPSQLTDTTDVGQAVLDMTENWAPSCTKTSVRLYSVSSISSSTTWNNQPSWASNYLYQDAAFGYPSCGYSKNDITWNVTSTVASDAGDLTNQTWGLRAADETDEYEWKQFWSGSSNFTLTVEYNYPPNTPSSLSTSPGGACHTSSSNPAQIGDDDVTFTAYASDNDTDNELTTRLQIYNPTGGTPVYDSATGNHSKVTGDRVDANLLVAGTQIQGFNNGGSTTPYTYYWQVQTTDDFGLTSSWSAKCWFTYNPQGPQAPGVQGPSSAAIGTSATFTFTDPPRCSPTTSPCPTSYTYQLGVDPPVTVTPTNGTWSGSILITGEGPILLDVYGSSAGGNPGEVTPFGFTGTAPSSPYPDGYFADGSHPDLLTTGINTATPSLWLSTGTGNGTLNSPMDIGSLGTTVNAGTQPYDGPADWKGALILHGSFTGDSIQDVIAYYPASGNGYIISGTGSQASLQPTSSNTWTIPASHLDDSSLCNQVTGSCDYPIDLVAAGNASQIGTGTDDLIGITGDSTNGYELDLYTSGCGGCGNPNSYDFVTALSTQAPNGTSWKSYTLATAQPGCYPGSTCNPANVVLFALNNITGKLFEFTNPTNSTQAVIGSGNWTPINVPWGSNPPALFSGDINSSGNIELWTQTGGRGGTLTAYTLNGSTLSAENSQPYNAPLSEWPLTDGSLLTTNPATPTAAVDTVGGNAATLTGGTTWNTDDYFNTDILGNQTGYLSPPASTIPSSNATPKISVWFKTATPDQVLVSLQASPLSSGSTTTSGYDPVMYIGTDGRLYAEWWNGEIDPAVSPGPVDDGLWHHAILTGYANSETLYIDSYQNGINITYPHAITLVTPDTNLAIGGGYIGGGWPTESHYQQNGSTGYRSYFTGEIADPVYSYPGGP